MANNTPSGLGHLERLLHERGGSESGAAIPQLMRRSAMLPDLSMVRMLLKLGARLDERDKDGRQPLHDVALYQFAGVLDNSFHARPEIMRTLLDAGAELDSEDETGDTPLSLAVNGGLAASVQFLLRVGADPIKHGQTGCPAPQYLIDYFSCANEADAISTLLAASSADVNAPDENGFRPLERAAWLGSPAAVKALVRAGADPNLPGRRGLRALHFAAELMHHPDGKDAIATLLKAGADPNACGNHNATPLLWSASKGSPTAILALLEAGANPSLLDQYDNSPLSFAGQLMSHSRGHEAVAALAEAAPATLNITDIEGGTPLHAAAFRGSPAAVRFLLKVGADPSIGKAPDYDPALLAAEMMRYHDGTDVVSAMLDMGCDTRQPGRVGISLRQFALSTNSLPLIKSVLTRDPDPLDTAVRTKMRHIRETYLALPSDSSDATELLALLSYLYSITGYYPSVILDQREVIVVPSLHPVGEGGFGECWKGTFLGNHSVAMKCTRSFVPQEAAIRRSWREVEIWKTLRHPNVLPFLGSLTLSSKLYLVSPWMASGDAREFVNRYPDIDRASILLQAAKGLHYLHTRNPVLVHGDLKAANVLISENGTVHIADFGLSRWGISGFSLGYSDAWRFAGNARWQAPELIRGLEDGDPERRTTESDVFAFGRFMTEIYTGEIPFSSLSDFAVLVSLLKGTLLPNRPTGPEVVSRGLNDIMWQLITDCCHEDLARRLTAQALVSRLQHGPGSTYDGDGHVSSRSGVPRDADSESDAPHLVASSQLSWYFMRGRRRPACFSREPNHAKAYTPFESFPIVYNLDDMIDLFPSLAHLPAVFVPHDVLHEDWGRCMSDLTDAWQGKRGDLASHRGHAVAVLIDEWNSSFFLTRSVELVLYCGRKQITALGAGGQVDEQLLRYLSSPSLSSSLLSSTGDNSSDGEDEEDGYMSIFDSTRSSRSWAEDFNQKSDHKEKRHPRKHEDKARGTGEDRYALFAICITSRSMSTADISGGQSGRWWSFGPVPSKP